MTIVSQYNDFACFAACLESFLRDSGREFNHEDFIKANLDIFNGGKAIEGCCDSANFVEAANRAGLILELLIPPVAFDLSGCAILLHLHWRKDPGQNHCVRFADQRDEALSIMNPQKSDSLDFAPMSWVRGIYKITLK